jgi:beta-RFAP synthase
LTGAETSMPRQIVISTGARLHCGPFAQGATTGRQFGGVGFMIRPPGFVLRAAVSDTDVVSSGEEHWRKRLETLVDRCRASCPSERQPPALTWEIVESLPPHAGLGSGTQLGIAAAIAMAWFAGETDVPIHVVARRSGRGLRSAVGLHGFLHGGLIVEGGKLTSDEISPLVARAEIPIAWRFLLIRPRDAAGLSGAEESAGFARLSPMTPAVTDRLCRLTLLDLLPAAITGDFPAFAEALHEFGRTVGEFFAPLQGGIFTDPQMRAVAERLASQGMRGIGQSSWGPTLFAACPDTAAADSLKFRLAADPTCANCDLTIAEPLNRGARIEVAD